MSAGLAAERSEGAAESTLTLCSLQTPQELSSLKLTCSLECLQCTAPYVARFGTSSAWPGKRLPITLCTAFRPFCCCFNSSFCLQQPFEGQASSNPSGS